MKGIYCTLFNKTYLDKGLALYYSLESVCKEFKLYVLAMDEDCYHVLEQLHAPHLYPISLGDFENHELLSVKGSRSFGEYCWTCSSSLIKYILINKNETICTYIDADMFFYSDPVILIEEMESKGATVLIVGHRYNNAYKYIEEISGKYCVQFNTFCNDEKSMSLLNIWIAQCIESVARLNDGIHYGDQKYLDKWAEDYPFVIETQNMGAGVAPWNIDQYRIKKEGNPGSLSKDNKDVQLVFYHFENITYKSETEALPNLKYSKNVDRKLINSLYIPYLQRLKEIKEMLKEKYGIDVMIKSHPIDIIKQSKFSVLMGLLSNPSALKKYLKSYYIRKQIIHFK